MKNSAFKKIINWLLIRREQLEHSLSLFRIRPPHDGTLYFLFYVKKKGENNDTEEEKLPSPEETGVN